jgi:hypothetical protein
MNESLAPESMPTDELFPGNLVHLRIYPLDPRIGGTKIFIDIDKFLS